MTRQHVVKFVQRVVHPAVQLMYPYLDEKRLRTQIAYMLPALRGADDMLAPKWVLQIWPFLFLLF